MTVKELRQYMREHQDNDAEWEKAYELFREKADWQKAPEGATWEEEKQFIKDFIASKKNN